MQKSIASPDDTAVVTDGVDAVAAQMAKTAEPIGPEQPDYLENRPRKDLWDKADILGKLLGSILIPVGLGIAGFFVNITLEDRTAKQNADQTAITILQSNTSTSNIPALRTWAEGVFTQMLDDTNNPLSAQALAELQTNVLPSPVTVAPQRATVTSECGSGVQQSGGYAPVAYDFTVRDKTVHYVSLDFQFEHVDGSAIKPWIRNSRILGGPFTVLAGQPYHFVDNIYVPSEVCSALNADDNGEFDFKYVFHGTGEKSVKIDLPADCKIIC